MNPKLILCLALFLCGGLFGCATTKTDCYTSLTSGENIRLPVKFADYRSLYAFIAKTENDIYGCLPTDNETLFRLAFDSAKSVVWFHNKDLPYFYVIEAHFYRGGDDEIRGATGNGDYYVVRPLATGRGLELIGILEGNTWKLDDSAARPRLVTTVHVSADVTPEYNYEWNGKFFEWAK